MINYINNIANLENILTLNKYKTKLVKELLENKNKINNAKWTGSIQPKLLWLRYNNTVFILFKYEIFNNVYNEPYILIVSFVMCEVNKLSKILDKLNQ